MNFAGFDLSIWHAVFVARPVRFLFIARSVSVLGDMVVPLALIFAVLSLTNSASDLGIVLAARAAPTVLFLLIGGVVGDRHNRRTIMVTAHAIAFATQGLAGVLILMQVHGIWWLAALMSIRGVTSAFFNPASTGAIAATAQPGLKQQTFALFGIAETIAEFSGPALAGILLIFLSPGWVLLIDAGSFLWSLAFIAFAGELGSVDPDARSRSLRHNFVDGLRFVRKTRWLIVLVISSSVFQFSMLSSIAVLGPFVANASLGGSGAWAVIVTALGIGGVVGSLLGIRFKPKRPLFVGYLLLLFGAGPTLFLLVVPAPIFAICLSEFVAGTAIGFFTILENAALATHVPQSMYSRVDAVSRFGALALRPVGLAVVGPIALVVGLQSTLLVAGVVSLCSVLWPLLSPSIRGLKAEATLRGAEEVTSSV